MFRLLRGKTTTISILALALPYALAEDGADVTIRVGHEGPQAYLVEHVDGAEDLSELNVENAPWTLRVGLRYRIVNPAATAHPLLLRGGSTVLLAQQGFGSFADDPEVAFKFDDRSLTFTLTRSLARELDNYLCAYHPTMTGPIVVTEVPAPPNGESEPHQ